MTDPLVSKEHARRVVGFRLVTFLCSYNVTGRNNNYAGSDAIWLPPLHCEDPVLAVHLILTSV